MKREKRTTLLKCRFYTRWAEGKLQSRQATAKEGEGSAGESKTGGDLPVKNGRQQKISALTR